MTACGFCVVAALSSQTSGRPLTRSCKDRKVAANGLDVERLRGQIQTGERGAGARNGSFLAGSVVAGVSWRISLRNGKRRESAGHACGGTAPGNCGVEIGRL